MLWIGANFRFTGERLSKFEMSGRHRVTLPPPGMPITEFIALKAVGYGEDFIKWANVEDFNTILLYVPQIDTFTLRFFLGPTPSTPWTLNYEIGAIRDPHR